MPTPNRPIPLAKSPRSQIWEKVLATLQASGTPLARFVRTFRALEGSVNDLAEGPLGAPSNLTEELMPWLRVSLVGTHAEWLAELQHKSSMIFVFELALPGTRITDLLDYWTAIEQQLFPGDNALLNALIPFGVFSKTIRDPAVTPRLIGSNSHALYAIGQIAFNHTIKS